MTCEVGDTGLEPVTPSLSSKGTSNASVDTKALTTTSSGACTAACTSEATDDDACASHDGAPDASDASQDMLERLAAELRKLLPADRERLAAMLIEHN